MTSTHKIESNKRNASRSTGPRTPVGKLRSRRNARRHGLATRIKDDPGARGGIERLATILAEGTDDFDRIEKSRVLAEFQFERRRIRVARYEIFLSINDMENVSINDFQIAMRAIDAISRYEKRALSKRKRAFRESPRLMHHLIEE
jgi:hypothetical protein